MKSAIPLIADLERALFAHRLLHRRCPLLDVLRCLLWIERRKACHRSPNNGGTEIETSDGRYKAVALIGLGENDRHVVQVVAPGVHIYRRIENPVPRSQ